MLENVNRAPDESSGSTAGLTSIESAVCVTWSPAQVSYSSSIVARPLRPTDSAWPAMMLYRTPLYCCSLAVRAFLTSSSGCCSDALILWHAQCTTTCTCTHHPKSSHWKSGCSSEVWGLKAEGWR